jgi:hypothetical protein
MWMPGRGEGTQSGSSCARLKRSTSRLRVIEKIVGLLATARFAATVCSRAGSFGLSEIVLQFRFFDYAARTGDQSGSGTEWIESSRALRLLGGSRRWPPSCPNEPTCFDRGASRVRSRVLLFERPGLVELEPSSSTWPPEEPATRHDLEQSYDGIDGAFDS